MGMSFKVNRLWWLCTSLGSWTATIPAQSRHAGIVAAICLFHVPTAAYMMTFDGVWVSSPDGTEISENLDDINAMISFMVWSLVLIPLFIYPGVFVIIDTVQVFCIAGLPCVAASILYYIVF